MNEYESKQEARRERYRDRAETLDAEAGALFDQNRQLADCMAGTPILIGHHSEKRHRRDIEKMDGRMRRGRENIDKAKELRRRAAGIGSAGISSDDPEALVKLREKLERLVSERDEIKKVNRAICKKGRTPESLAAAMGWKLETAVKALEPDVMGAIGFPSYVLSNRGAVIRSTKKRIAAMEAEVGAVEVEEDHDGITLEESPTDNRIRLIFPGKPSPEVRGILKRHGFRWSPMAGAWQRHLNNAGRYAARYVLDLIGGE